MTRNEYLTELNRALEEYGSEASVILMPYGGSTLPCLNA